MSKTIDVRNIVDIHYVVKVGDTHFDFESGAAAMKFAETARRTCSETRWDDNEYRVSIDLFPVWREDPEEEEPEESDDIKVRCDEKLEKECEA